MRRELTQALTALQYEEPGMLNSQRARGVAINHVRTAMLLLTGSTTDNIVGHPKGSSHNQEARHS